MNGQQYTPAQRNFMSMKYQELRGQRGFMQEIIREFIIKFPGAPLPTRLTINKPNKKQNTHYTVHNLNSRVIKILLETFSNTLFFSLF